MSREGEAWKSLQDMAKKYRLSDDTVRRKVKDGAWPADRIGRLYRFSPEQQEEIAEIVSGKRDSGYDKNRIAEALRKLSA